MPASPRARARSGVHDRRRARAQVTLRPEAASDEGDASPARCVGRVDAERARRRWTPSGGVCHSRGRSTPSAGMTLHRVTPPRSQRRRRRRPEPAAALDAGRRGRGRGRRGRDRAGVAGRPDGGGVLRRRQHGDAGRLASSTSPAACTAASSSPPATSSAPPGSRPTSGSSASRTPSTSPRPAPPRSAFIAGHTVAELEELGEEIFDEAMAHRIWPGTRALAQLHLDQGQRVWLVTAAPIEIARIIARRLGLTGAMGTVAEHVDGVYTGRLVGEHAARPGQGRGGQGARRARGARPGPLLGVLRLLQRPADALPGRRPLRDQPRRPAARPRPAAGLAGPRLPHRPQGGPGRACSPPASPARWPARSRRGWRSAAR